MVPCSTSTNRDSSLSLSIISLSSLHLYFYGLRLSFPQRRLVLELKKIGMVRREKVRRYERMVPY